MALFAPVQRRFGFRDLGFSAARSCFASRNGQNQCHSGQPCQTGPMAVNLATGGLKHAQKKDRPGERGAPPGHKEGMMRHLLGAALL